MHSFFVKRPIFAAVISIIIVLAGIVASRVLPISQYPEIAPPTVTITAAYPGASAEVVADTVATPIEQEINGVEGMLYMSSTCSNDGTISLSIVFDLGTDLDTAQVLVLASKAFAFYYGLQCAVAAIISSDTRIRLGATMLAAVMFAITVFAIPVG